MPLLSTCCVAIPEPVNSAGPGESSSACSSSDSVMLSRAHSDVLVEIAVQARQWNLFAGVFVFAAGDGPENRGSSAPAWRTRDIDAFKECMRPPGMLPQAARERAPTVWDICEALSRATESTRPRPCF